MKLPAILTALALCLLTELAPCVVCDEPETSRALLTREATDFSSRDTNRVKSEETVRVTIVVDSKPKWQFKGNHLNSLFIVL